MAKTESTAVNALIEGVRNSRPLPSEPGADLFAMPRSMPGHPPRMTSTIPPVRGAGELPPLPRTRAPQSTSTHAAPPVHPHTLRMASASPARGTTIPPVPPPVPVRASSPSTLPRASGPVRASSPSTTLPPPIPVRASSPSTTLPPPVPTRASSPSTTLPPPVPSRAASPSAASLASAPAPAPVRDAAAEHELAQRVSTPRASSPNILVSPDLTATTGEPPVLRTAPSGTLPPPSRTLPPASTPIAAPFEVAPVEDSPFAAPPRPMPRAASPLPSSLVTGTGHLAPDRTGEAWFDVTANVHKRAEDWNTVAVRRVSDARTTLARQLVVPGLIALAVGVAGGAFFAFGQKKTQASAPAASAVTARAAASGADSERVVRMRPVTPVNTALAASDLHVRAEQAAGEVTGLTQDVPAQDAHTVQTPRGAVTLVDVRVDSQPSGATVTIIDRGQQTFLGTTPLSTSVDASRVYDLIVALDGRPTQMVHLDPAATTRIEVALASPVPQGAVDVPAAREDETTRAIVEEKRAAQEAREAREAARAAELAAQAEREAAREAAKAEREATQAAKAAAQAEREATQAAKAAAQAEREAAKKAARDERRRREREGREDRRAASLAATVAELADETPAPRQVAGAREADTHAAATGTGTLMVSSKPPCELVIDGKPTGLTTPQRSISLAAGTHKVTFVNATAGIKKTVSVSIKPGKPTKLIQDLMPR